MTSPETIALARRQVRFGWIMLAVFAVGGIVLEAFHGFKTGWYLEEAYQTRRLLFTLGHAHGALLALVNVIFGVAAAVLGGDRARLVQTSRLLTAGTALLPAGFFLGGFGLYGGDPGVGIYLVPIGAICVLAAFAAAAFVGTGQSAEIEDPHTEAKRVRSKKK